MRLPLGRHAKAAAPAELRFLALQIWTGSIPAAAKLAFTTVALESQPAPQQAAQNSDFGVAQRLPAAAATRHRLHTGRSPRASKDAFSANSHAARKASPQSISRFVIGA